MNDTSPRADALVLALLRKRTPMDRLQMAGDMFAAARAFLESALEQQGLVRGTVAWRLAILDRMYGQEISPSCRRRLIERWSTERTESGSRR